ncbi:MAG: nickel pincer cofactor biosynthesis protein LarB [Paracoccaceae bacterium]|nr:MAG: nickel pincer cofactor biosynthesis protein LarB [Paracoccaceae bacterium]
MSDHRLDFGREDRTGVPEVVLASGKTAEQIARIVETVLDADGRMLITRLDPAKAGALHRFGTHLRFDPESHTAEIGTPPAVASRPSVAVVAAGTSDLRVAREAVRSLAFLGEGALLVADVGVAGLWRLTERLDAIRSCPVAIAVAGMEGALFSVLAGLVRAPVIAVPTSVGYGVAEGGRAALSSALASCAPGVVVVNIDNGFGAAAAAVKILNAARPAAG